MMNRLPTLFMGMLLTFSSAWIGLVVVPWAFFGTLEPVQNPSEMAMPGEMVPPPVTGNIEAGLEVYAANGCVYCHTQQVRPERQGSDIKRGWGTRRTVPRDYIREKRVFLGTMRTGPDLTNVGVRLQDPAWHHQHLYAPRSIYPNSTMPNYAFLYDVREIQGQGSPEAIQDLPPENAPPPGYEIVPTQEARDLVAYLLSLKRNYPLPEVPPDF
ncbi:MAG: cbb3-type cytochrome c oxidase subunit II [Verrucomicrobiota bacterium]